MVSVIVGDLDQEGQRQGLIFSGMSFFVAKVLLEENQIRYT